MNVDENGETAMKYGITGIPSLLVFKDGEMVKQFVGVQQDGELVSTLESYM
jgi:thioredoxin 1